MNITGTNGNILIVNVNTPSALFEVEVVENNNSNLVTLDLEQIKLLLPSLAAAKDALAEATKTKQKQQVEDLKAQIEDLKLKIAEIQAL